MEGVFAEEVDSWEVETSFTHTTFHHLKYLSTVPTREGEGGGRRGRREGGGGGKEGEERGRGRGEGGGGERVVTPVVRS